VGSSRRTAILGTLVPKMRLVLNAVPIGDTLRQKALRYQQTARPVLNRQPLTARPFSTTRASSGSKALCQKAPCRSGRPPTCSGRRKNQACAAVKRAAEEEWGHGGGSALVLAIVRQAAVPLSPSARDRYLKTVAAELAEAERVDDATVKAVVETVLCTLVDR
jgi:hypothetical protein